MPTIGSLYGSIFFLELVLLAAKRDRFEERGMFFVIWSQEIRNYRTLKCSCGIRKRLTTRITLKYKTIPIEQLLKHIYFLFFLFTLFFSENLLFIRILYSTLECYLGIMAFQTTVCYSMRLSLLLDLVNSSHEIL